MTNRGARTWPGRRSPSADSSGASAAAVVATLLALGLAALVLLLLVVRDDGATSSGIEAAGVAGDDPLRSGVIVSVRGCERRGDSLWTEGLIRNDGRVTVRYVEISLAWADSSGVDIERDTTEVVGSESLMPGESTTFAIPTANPVATDCSASLFTYEPTP